jgi:hypothetical protein
VPAEQVGGGQQAAFGGPGQEGLPHRAWVLDRHSDQDTADIRRILAAQQSR